MAAVNKVILIGNLGRDPELRRTQTGSAVTNFSIATTEKFKGKDGAQKEETEWHNIVAWNRTAEVMAQYLKKGSSVYIEGKLRTRSWEDNGIKKYKTEILVREFQFLGGRGEGGGSQQGGESSNFGEAPAGFDSGFSQEPQGFGGGSAPQQSGFGGGGQQSQPQSQSGFGGAAPQQQAPSAPVQPQMPVDEDLPF